MTTDIRYLINLVSQPLNEEIDFIPPDEFHGDDRKKFYEWYKSKRKQPYRDVKVPFTLVQYNDENPELAATETAVVVWISGSIDNEEYVDSLDIEWIEAANPNQEKLNYDQIFSVWFACMHNDWVQECLEEKLITTLYKRASEY